MISLDPPSGRASISSPLLLFEDSGRNQFKPGGRAQARRKLVKVRTGIGVEGVEGPTVSDDEEARIEHFGRLWELVHFPLSSIPTHPVLRDKKAIVVWIQKEKFVTRRFGAED